MSPVYLPTPATNNIYSPTLVFCDKSFHRRSMMLIISNILSSLSAWRTSTTTLPSSSCPITRRTTWTKTFRSGRPYWKWKPWTRTPVWTPRSCTKWATIISPSTLRASSTTTSNWTPTTTTRITNSSWPPKTKVG